MLEFRIPHKFTGWTYLVGWVVLCIILPNSFLQFYKFKYFFPFWVVGFLLHRIDENLVLKRLRGLTGICICIFLALLSLYWNSDGIKLFYSFSLDDLSLSQIALGVALSILSIVILFSMSMYLSKHKIGEKICGWGIYSMDVYLIHMFFIKLLYRVPKSVVLNKIALGTYNILVSTIIIMLIVIWVKNCGIKLKVYRFITGRQV